MDDSALALAKLINSEDFQGKLRQFVAEKEAAERAGKDAAKAKAEAEATILAMNQLHIQQIADLAKAKAEHDKSANEAALRLDLANSVKQGLDDRAAELDKRLADLEEREKQVDAAHTQLTGAFRQLGLSTG